MDTLLSGPAGTWCLGMFLCMFIWSPGGMRGLPQISSQGKFTPKVRHPHELG